MGARPRKPLAKCQHCGYFDRLSEDGYCDGCRRSMRERDRQRVRSKAATNRENVE